MLSLEQALKNQIREISDSSNCELHNWWNWHPKMMSLEQGRDDNFTGIGDDEHPYYERKYPDDDAIRDDCSPEGENGHRLNDIILPGHTTMQIIVSDLHDQVIDSCSKYFSDWQLPVTLKQEPIQATILHALQTKAGTVDRTGPISTHTFIVFGGYGSGQCHSGLQKQLQELFPHQMVDLVSQAHAGCDHADNDDFELNMRHQGQVWLARPAIEADGGLLYLISCAAYPRCQSPSEQEHISKLFSRALHLVMATVQCGGGRDLYNPSDCHRTVKVITHAMGSFVGHTDPSVFGQGLAGGLMNFLTEFS